MTGPYLTYRLDKAFLIFVACSGFGMPNPQETPMDVSNFESIESVYKDDVIAAAEALMINCHHLASDILDLAEKDAGIEPSCARTLSRQLSECAGKLAVTVEKINQGMRGVESSVAGCP